MKRLVTLCALLMITAAGTIQAAEIKSPTTNVLIRLLWLGDTANRPRGSGTLVSHDGVEYLVTAFHVFRDSGGNPTVRFREQWIPLKWEVVAKDEDLDVIVLKSAQLPADLGVNRRAIVTHYRGNRRPKLTPLKLIDSTRLVVWTDGVTGDVDSGDDCADPSGSSGSGGADQADCP